jgi:hypothetical protein
LDKTTNGTEKDNRETHNKNTGILIGKEMATSNAERIDLAILKEREPLLAETIKVIEDSRINGLKSIDYIERKFYVGNKDVLLYLRFLINISCEATKYGFANGFAIEYLQKKTELLEKALGILSEKSSATQKKLLDDLEKLKASVDSPMIANIHNFVETMKKNIAEYQKKREENDLAE